MSHKKVSLILTTYNCKNNLEKTLKSIEEQDYPNIEVVIKDAKSTDGTLDVIKEYQKKSRFQVIWKSEIDTGIYEGMNQGYNLSSGEIIAFFNDVFLKRNSVSLLVSKLEENKFDISQQYVGVHADLVYMNEDQVVRKWKMGKGSIYEGWMPGHPTLFLKREIYEKYGLYDTSYKISADYEFMIRFLKDEENELAYLPELVVSMFYGGTSSNGLKSYMASYKESYKALKKNGIKGAWLINSIRTIRVIMQFTRRKS